MFIYAHILWLHDAYDVRFISTILMSAVKVWLKDHLPSNNLYGSVVLIRKGMLSRSERKTNIFDFTIFIKYYCHDDNMFWTAQIFFCRWEFFFVVPDFCHHIATCAFVIIVRLPTPSSQDHPPTMSHPPPVTINWLQLKSQIMRFTYLGFWSCLHDC